MKMILPFDHIQHAIICNNIFSKWNNNDRPATLAFQFSNAVVFSFWWIMEWRRRSGLVWCWLSFSARIKGNGTLSGLGRAEILGLGRDQLPLRRMCCWLGCV